MIKKKFIGAMAVTIALGLGVVAYADTNSQGDARNYNLENRGRMGFSNKGVMGGFNMGRGFEINNEILKKYGFTEEEISKKLAEGKTIYDIAKEKGITLEDFKSTMKEQRLGAIDEAVKDGKITAEQGDMIKTNIENNINSCTTPGENSTMRGQKQGKGQGRKQGQGRGNCILDNSSQSETTK